MSKWTSVEVSTETSVSCIFVVGVQWCTISTAHLNVQFLSVVVGNKVVVFKFANLGHILVNKTTMMVSGNKKITIFIEVTTSASAGFYVGPLFSQIGKAITNNKLNPHVSPGQNQTWATQHWWEVSALTSVQSLLPKLWFYADSFLEIGHQSFGSETKKLGKGFCS